jgi:NH3-dependent NAD+ synthetase
MKLLIPNADDRGYLKCTTDDKYETTTGYGE